MPQAIGSKSTEVVYVMSSTVDGIAMELKRCDHKRLNVILFGLSLKAGTDDKDLFLDLIDREILFNSISPN